MQPLAVADQSSEVTYTNLSRMVSLTLFNENNTEIPIETSDQFIEILIPRGSAVENLLSEWETQSIENSSNHSFNYHFMDISHSKHLEISLHFEMKPLNASKKPSYLLVYQFDTTILSDRIDGDGIVMLCKGSKNFIFEFNQTIRFAFRFD